MKYTRKDSFRKRWFPTVTETQRFSRRYDFDSIGLGICLGRWLRTVALGSVLAYGGSQVIGNSIEYSQGTRIGVINNFSNKGLFWKTHEGQMVLEGIVSDGSRSVANVFDFSLDRTARYGENISTLAEQLQGVTDRNVKVKVTYKQTLFTWPWRSSSGYHVQTVTPLQENK